MNPQRDLQVAAHYRREMEQFAAHQRLLLLLPRLTHPSLFQRLVTFVSRLRRPRLHTLPAQRLQTQK